MQLSKEQRIQLLDPVYFAETLMSNWMPDGLREFQKKILRYRGRQVVMRIGRRSGKTHLLAVKAVFEAVSNPLFRITVVTPTEQQSKLIFNMIVDNCILQSPVLKQCMTRFYKSPPRIEFTNKSYIAFFTAGSSTGSGAVSLRGQGGDLIIIDEADYLAENDLASILGLLAEAPHIQLWASSTPTGKRSHFYEWCTNEDMGFKPFHFPTCTANPHWNEEMEILLKNLYPGDVYAREVMAEFGTEESGVFNKIKLDMSKDKGEGLYNHSTLNHPFFGYMQKPQHEAIRVFGVDWDKKSAPTNIIVLEITPDNQFMVMNRTQVAQSEYTLTNAVDTIVRMNRIWKPRFIYVDRGYGETQVELLRLLGQQMEGSNLHKIVKPIQAASKIDFYDPVVGEKDRKDAKHLMINLLSNTVDNNKLILNPHDKDMFKQLIDYRIEKYGAMGKPIFTNKNDHCVDALALAHLGMAQNFSQIFKINSEAVYYFNKYDFDKQYKYADQQYLSYEDFIADRENKYYNPMITTQKRIMNKQKMRPMLRDWRQRARVGL